MRTSEGSKLDVRKTGILKVQQQSVREEDIATNEIEQWCDVSQRNTTIVQKRRVHRSPLDLEAF